MPNCCHHCDDDDVRMRDVEKAVAVHAAQNKSEIAELRRSVTENKKDWEEVRKDFSTVRTEVKVSATKIAIYSAVGTAVASTVIGIVVILILHSGKVQ